MKYKTFSPDIWAQINKTLDLVLQQDSQPVAAFDADGTLWDIDLGENFFEYIIQNKLVSLPPDPWEHYETMKRDPAGPQKAYLWLAQILKGQSLAKAQAWASKAVSELNPLPVFPEQKKLIELFLSRGVQILIVTASVKWAVEPGARALGLSDDHVIGIETSVENSMITDQLKGLITYRQGKAEALLKRTGGKKPFFSSGNTFGDLALMEASTRLRLAVTSSVPDDRLFRSEQELYSEAQKRGWMHHRFN
jgi:phosphoserine phosphatase